MSNLFVIGWYVFIALSILSLTFLGAFGQYGALAAYVPIVVLAGILIIVQKRQLDEQTRRNAEFNKLSYQSIEKENEKVKLLRQKCDRMTTLWSSQLDILLQLADRIYTSTPENLTGPKLRDLRYQVLDAAYIGFRAIKKFTWNAEGHELAFRDYVERKVVGSSEEDVVELWHINFVRAAWQAKPVSEKDQLGRPSSNRPAAPSI